MEIRDVERKRYMEEQQQYRTQMNEQKRFEKEIKI